MKNISSFETFNESGPSSSQCRDEDVDLVTNFISLLYTSQDEEDFDLIVNKISRKCGITIPLPVTREERKILLRFLEEDPTMSFENDDMLKMNFEQFKSLLASLIKKYEDQLTISKSQKLKNVHTKTNMFENSDFPLPLKVKMVMMSHLSDVQDTYGMMDANEARSKINFVKYLMMKYPNTDTEINADDEWALFLKKYPRFKF